MSQSTASTPQPASTPQVSPLCVLVNFEFTDTDGIAFDQAAGLVQHSANGQLHLVHVFETAPSAERKRDLVGHLRLYVNEKAALLGGLRGTTVGIHLRSGPPVREIAQLATDLQASLIVVGSHHGGGPIKQWFGGGSPEKLADAAPCPVLVARPKGPPATLPEVVVEPPCPDCLRARAASGGRQWWCERHSARATHGHVFSYQREIPLSFHDSDVIPTGIDF